MPNMIRDFSDPGFNHGTLGGYKKDCRCYECRRARADYDMAQKGREPKFLFLKGMPLDHPDYPHGTVRGYRYCKCDKCRAANAQYRAPFNTVLRQSDEFKARQREFNLAYKESEHGRNKRRAHHAARKAAIRGAGCSDADKRLMETIYATCPKGHQVDHILPIAKGGKHHPDNLQYLPAEVNNAKRAKTDFDCSAHAIKWQDLVDRSTTIPQGSRAKRPEVPSDL